MLDEQLQCSEQPGRQIQCFAVKAAHALLRRFQHEFAKDISVQHRHGQYQPFSQIFQKQHTTSNHVPVIVTPALFATVNYDQTDHET